MTTTIRVSEEIREQLKKLALYRRESMDDILRRLLAMKQAQSLNKKG